MKHYLHGRAQIADASLAPASPGTDAAPMTSFDAPAAGPNVEVIKQGDRVTRLVVTCSCGERIEVECVYPTAG